jgi:hypothetical protein
MICRHGTDLSTELSPPCHLCRIESLEERIAILNKDIKAAWDTNRAIDNARMKEWETVQRYKFIRKCAYSSLTERNELFQRIKDSCLWDTVPTTDEEFDSLIDKIRRLA